MEILLYPDPQLRQKAEPIGEITDEIKEKAHELFDLIDQHGGIGLAAPQVGWGVRLFAINTTGKPEDSLVLVNPEIVETSGGSWVMDEGCLSLPSINGKVKRPKKIVVKAQSLEGEEFVVEADGLVGRCIMHEFDHLEGILFIDRLSAAKKIALKKKLKTIEKVHELRTAAEAK